MITAMSEWIDMLYTRLATELAEYEWEIVLKERMAQPSIVIGVDIDVDGSKFRVRYNPAFMAVETGRRVDTDTMATVADYHMKLLKDTIKDVEDATTAG